MLHRFSSIFSLPDPLSRVLSGRDLDTQGAEKTKKGTKESHDWLIASETQLVRPATPRRRSTPIYLGLSLNAFPTELLLDIFSYLPYWDANVNILRVNKRFYNIIRAEKFNETSRLRVDHHIRGKTIASHPRSLLTFPPSKFPEERIERIKFHVNPDISSFTCHYTRESGLTCYYETYEMLKTKDRPIGTSVILLRPLVSPIVPKVRVKVNPMKYFRAPKVFGGSCFSESYRKANPGKHAVTILDLINWLAQYLQEKTMMFENYKCFRISVRVDNISSKGDECADLHVNIYHVVFAKFQRLRHGVPELIDSFT